MPRFAEPVRPPSARKSASKPTAPRPLPRGLRPSQQAALWHVLQLKAAERAAAAPAQAPAAPSRGGLPERLKAGVEQLSGLAMDDVRVHRDSPEPANLGALAFTKGSDIHLGPGQEQHLPHEAWHVVQQKQGRVKATMQLKGAAINDDTGLEREADRMGGLAAESQMSTFASQRHNRGESIARWPMNFSRQQGRVIQRQPQQSANVLTANAAAAAAADVTSRFDQDSIRTLEFLASRPRDGVFDASDAEALARAQRSISLPATGKADVRFLDSMLGLVGPTAAWRSALIHLVVDHANLNVSAALSVVHEPSLAAASARQTSPGGVSTIQIGNRGFASYRVMVGEIGKQLAARTAASPVTAVPAATLTDPTSQKIAIALNQNTLDDPRSIRLLQGALKSRVTGKWDVDLVRHIAAKQQTLGLSLSGGILWERTFSTIVTEMITNGERDSVLHLIVDYYNLDRSHAFNIVFNPNAPNATDNAQTLYLGGVGTPGVVHIYPPAFAGSFPGLVHTVAHELGHIRQMVQGVGDLNVREFLSEGIEIESDRMPTESIEPDADIDLMIQGLQPTRPGFIQDAQRMLQFWRQMSAADKQAHLARFQSLRTIIISRINGEGTPTQKSKLAPFITLLNRS